MDSVLASTFEHEVKACIDFAQKEILKTWYSLADTATQRRSVV
jgi:hypothetical protein